MKNFNVNLGENYIFAPFKSGNYIEPTKDGNRYLLRIQKSGGNIAANGSTFSNGNGATALISLEKEHGESLLAQGFEAYMQSALSDRGIDCLYGSLKYKMITIESYEPQYEGQTAVVWGKTWNGQENPLEGQPQTRDGKPFYRKSEMRFAESTDKLSEIVAADEVKLTVNESVDSHSAHLTKLLVADKVS